MHVKQVNYCLLQKKKNLNALFCMLHEEKKNACICA